MIHKIRNSRLSKIIASYLAIQMIVSIVQPNNLYALTGGPSQPEFNSFTPIGTSDMVNLSTGDFNYNIPIMDVGGYPLNLAYDSGVTMDQEASWVGLGWNLNVGQIARQVRGIPDDFNGDKMVYENDMKENITVGTNVGVGAALAGFPVSLGLDLGMGVQYNNYEGITFHPSFGVSFGISDNVQVGMNVSSSTAEGATVSPSISFSAKKDNESKKNITKLSGGVGVSLNSRKGLENLSLSASVTRADYKIDDKGEKNEGASHGLGGSGNLSFNSNNVYTPQKRAGTVSGNFSFNASIGVEVVCVELDGHIMGYGSYQQIRNSEKNKSIPSFGYDFTEYADKGNSVLDFNRENDKSFNKNTTVLPIANHTYDIYAMQGQGLSGMFRPHRGQVSYLMDNKVSDFGDGFNVGIELGVVWNVHAGVDVKVSPSYSYTGGWEDGNYALNLFNENSTENNSLPYEKVYYKTVGELNVDSEPTIFDDQVHSNNPLRFSVGGNKYNRTLMPTFEAKEHINGVPDYTYNSHNINSKIKRTVRDRRNSAIQKVSQLEADDDPLVGHRTNSLIKPHHTAGMKILKPDGSTYVYGETAYNWTKEEITVDVSGATGDCSTGLVPNNGDVDSNNSDAFRNVIKTPAYAHTYLLSSVLSSDYEDISQNGPTTDDLGSYTVFKYGESGDPNHYIGSYSWRTPYENTDVNPPQFTANYNEGLKSIDNDQKGSIIKGTKELRYIRTIETKTHVAYFQLSDRKDGIPSGGGITAMKKIDKIYLFSRPEFEPFRATIENNGNPDSELLQKAAIKTAHFVYDYGLCTNLPNNNGNPSVLDDNELANQDGKLSLKEVYFTYRGSNMGRYTPYLFHYDNLNPEYNIKGYDIWGNYKENLATGCEIDDPLTTMEFPFVEQDKTIADSNTSAWTLSSIDLPSGGNLEIETEADDYQFVQNRKAMQMFKIYGFSDTPDPTEDNSILYNGGSHTRYMNIKISEEEFQGYSGSDFMEDYLKENADKPIFFRALLNMVKNTSTQYDFVEGYFEIEGGGNGVDGGDFTTFADNSGTYVSIPLRMLEAEGGWIPGGGDVNPITKAGWYFGRSYLNRVVYSISGDNTNDDFGSIVKDLVSSIGAVFEIFTGPNIKLQEKQCARNIKLDKSWIRLENPNGRKYGGGVRVKKIQLHDNWALMDQNTNNNENPLYNQFYGQEYSYVLDDENGTSSGVAAFEPNGSKENPFVEPFYDNAGSKKDQLVAPQESNYTEKPLGESFFPAASVTYSRVSVKNLERQDANENLLTKHATGKVVTEFYTTRDFPTKTDHTDITSQFDPPGALASILNISVRNHLTFSQGFVVETNDMNGREKSQRVYPEGQEAFISGVDYIYNTTAEGDLSSEVTTIDKEGVVATNKVGLTYDVYNDFRENYSESTTFGFDFNVAGFVIFVIPIVIPMPIPDYAYHETKLRTASTTKVIHRSAILKEKIAYDVGSKVSTKNLAWDAHTGQVILTETVNEYDDHYYNLTYPTHWYYKGMDMAARNLGIQGSLHKLENDHDFNINAVDLREIFTLGDEIQTPLGHFWVGQIMENNVVLMDSEGILLNDECDPMDLDFKIVRSGYRNQQMASMASVTSMLNPIDLDQDGYDPNDNGILDFDNITSSTYLYLDGQGVDPRIVNASAVEYKEAWPQQWENGLPGFPDALTARFGNIDYGDSPIDDIQPFEYGFNPYLYNVRGEWRAKRSYAYLTSRVSNVTGSSSPRFEGYFEQFSPYYMLDPNDGWQIDVTTYNENNPWTFASEVSQYSPYGAELENKDALGRYSAAQYGYNYTLPTAVASNSQYREIGFDGFEDYDYQGTQNSDAHFNVAEISTNIVSTTSHTGRNSLMVQGISTFGISYNEECLEIEVSVDHCTPPTCNNPPQELACCIDMEGNGHEISFTEGAENATIIAGDTNIDIIQATPSTGIIVQFGSNHVECITVIGGGGGSFASFTVAYTLNDIYHCVEIIADTSDNCQ
jgi:hypothetical protein